ncbi:GAF and ANTAR domain-containing protein [Nocardioides sp. CPCC 205120]|uniref:GAF and ANTAR domain-containing protein n=1 Tax=Nocardioides sp. CPCC 205120 TaxID=3406462 RepID=UPI003B514611
MNATDPLPERMASAARELQHEEDAQTTLEAAVRLAVTNVEGCDAAGVSIVHRSRRIDTPASTDELALRADVLQHETGEGPCLDAIRRAETVCSPSLAHDERWPVWGPRVVAETGARSVLACRLFTLDDTVGALTLYSRSKDAFGPSDVEEASALAAHAAVAIAAAREIEGLGIALDTRTLTGQATGILMERFDIDSRRAFEVMVRLSSAGNTKLRDIAGEIVATRGAPGQRP